MSFIVVIPSRFASSRLPGKPLEVIGDKPMIAHVVDRASESAASKVIVATDDERIEQACVSSGIDCCMTSAEHQSGSDRIAEVINTYQIADDAIIVNVQGDEPFISARLINEVAQILSDSSDAVMSTAAHMIEDPEEIENPNVVKVVFNKNNEALYFSRSTIPYAREDRLSPVWRHIGIYAYRAGFLKRYSELPSSDMEVTESLEQLRVLDAGEKILVQSVDYDTGFGIDTPEDLAKARAYYAKSS